ncbi:hypothetical protein HHK36_031989 [Tetracentron sinense]|uniref:Uncharacterized protein n=1 Tax=Tetracentron sinense TaxID=13715 RepID=A0A835CY25_TETSI|nr:hypothetical protein HHK36_031989 [Tetracentron sinense]
MFAYDSTNENGIMRNGTAQVSTPVNKVKPVKYDVSPAKVTQVERQSLTENEVSSNPSEEDRSIVCRKEPASYKICISVSISNAKDPNGESRITQSHCTNHQKPLVIFQPERVMTARSLEQPDFPLIWRAIQGAGLKWIC